MHDGLVQVLEFAVQRADLDFGCGRPHLAELELRATLRASTPGPDDLVALSVEGAQVFAVPFGRFEPAKHHGVVVPDVFVLRAHHLRVRLDFGQGRLAVAAEKVKLAGYHPDDGVDVELLLGDAVATDTVQPRSCGEEGHHRDRCRPWHGHGHGHGEH